MKNVKIKCIKKIPNETVFDITVPDEHHYILENGVITHNSGLKYAGSTIVYLSRKKDKEGDKVVGNIIKAVLKKGRLTRENTIVEMKLSYEDGLNRYYGLVGMAIDSGVFKKRGSKITLPDNTETDEDTIYSDPETYLDPYLDQINVEAAKIYKYGSDASTEEIDISEMEEVQDD